MSDSALGRLTEITYNDGTTPTVIYEYRRDGSVAAIDDAAGLRVMSDWSAQGRAQREVIGASQLQDRPDLLVGLQWQQPLDALGRRAGHGGQYSLSGIALELPSATWAYDAATGRMSTVQSGGLTASWAWSQTATQSTRTLTRSASGSQAQPSLTSVQEQNPGRGLFSHSHSRSGTVIQSRTRGTLANSHQIEYRDPHFGVVGGANEMSTWIYGSDSRGQITSARKRLDAVQDTPYAPGWDASYAYDDLGNRVAWGQGSAQQSDLSDLELTSYSRNALHQYTAISGVNASRVTGQAPASQEVKINGVTAERAGHFYHRRMQDGARSDLTLPHWLEVTVTATTTLPNAQTVTAQRAGSLWQPPIPEEPVYDFDGNLIEDGRWLYTWDAENRLIQMLTRPAAVAAGAPNWRLSFAYDHQSRRIQKKVEVLNGSVWEVRSDARFIYDGWNVVAEVELNGAAWDAPGGTSAMDPRPAYVRRSWVWGEDVSGTLDGAGGVGGLLVVTRHARGGQGRESYWAMSDLNGNVTGLVSTTSGRMAVYEYDAFGRLLRENEPEPGLNPVRFSSKYQDVETGLVYYGYRYYSSEMGRWISRDPIEEQGGINLYGMVGNDVVNQVDVLGMIESDLRYKGLVYGSFNSEFSAAVFGAQWSANLSEDAGKKNSPSTPWTAQVEYGGSICKCESTCEIGITVPRTDNNLISVTPSKCPEGWTTLGTFHSHPHIGNTANSEGDMDNADPVGISSTVLRVNSSVGNHYRGNPNSPRGGEQTPFEVDPEWGDKFGGIKKLQCK